MSFLSYSDVASILSEGSDIHACFDPNQIVLDWDNTTYFLLACWMNNLKVAKGLLKLGADIAAKDTSGNTALMHACLDSKGQSELIKWLLCQPEVVASINDTTTDYGYSALCYAAYYGNMSIIRMLLHYGADRDATITNGTTAAQWARTYGKEESAQFIEDWTPIDEWRPWTHHDMPQTYRSAIRTLVLLAKTEFY